LQSFETELLAEEEGLAGLAAETAGFVLHPLGVDLHCVFIASEPL
jgi:hypothetical protein